MEISTLINSMVRKDLIDIINRMKKCHSSSMFNKIISDLTMLYEISDILKLDNVIYVEDYAFKTYSLDPTAKERIQKRFYINSYELNSELTDNYIYLLNKYVVDDFKYNLDRMDNKECELLIADFTKWLDKRIYSVFEKCAKSGRIIYVPSKGYNFSSEGETFYGNFFKPYMLIEDCECLFTAHTLSHETGHLYDFSICHPSTTNYLREVFSYFMELAFIVYLKEQKMYYESIKNNFFEILEDNVVDLSNLLNENITTKLDFRQKYSVIHSNLEYTYGMILALGFFYNFLEDKELGLYQINEFSKNKNDFKNPFEVMKKFNFDEEGIVEGKVLEKIIKRI